MGQMNRRTFLAASAAAAGLAVLPAQGAPAAPAPQVCVFSKHLQFLDYPGLAKACREAGLDGVDLTVRSGGHVEPGRLDDLSRAVDAIRAEGIEVPMISTRLVRGDDPDARPILEAAAKAGIPFVRIDGGRYEGDGDPLAQLPAHVDGLRTLAAIAQDVGVTLGFHNHSGADRVGAVLWDLHRMIREVDLDSLGSNFDVGHATVVGGLKGWQINARLMAPHVKMMAVKDFTWEGDQAKWVPLGEGIVDTGEFLRIFRAAGFSGPISLHFEYRSPSNVALLEDIRRAAAYLRKLL